VTLDKFNYCRLRGMHSYARAVELGCKNLGLFVFFTKKNIKKGFKVSKEKS